MIRIAQILVGKTWSGGQNQVYQLLKNQPDNFESILITEEGSLLGKKVEELKKIPVYYLTPHSHIDFSYIKKVKEILKKHQIDIVNVHRSTVHTNILVLKMFFYKNFKLIITRRINYPQNFFSKIKYNNKWIDHYIAVSQEVKKTLIANGISASKIDVIYSGVDEDKFKIKKSTLKEELNIDNKKEVITCVANFLPRKGLEYLLKAIALGEPHFQKAVFIFVGTGTDSDEFKQLIRSMGIEKLVIPLGYREDIPNILADTDIFVLPTLQEGFSGVIREAMIMGKPIITTRIPENLELVRDGVNGFLCEPKNEQSLLNNILKLYQNTILQKQLGKKGKEIILKNFTIKHTVNNTYNLYKQLLNM